MWTKDFSVTVVPISLTLWWTRADPRWADPL